MFNWSNFKKKKQRHLCLWHFSSLSLFYFYHHCFNHQELPIILIKLFRDKDETVGRSRVCDVHKRARGKQRGAQHPPHAPPHHDQPPPLPPHHRHHQVRLWAELWRSSRRELPVKKSSSWWLSHHHHHSHYPPPLHASGSSSTWQLRTLACLWGLFGRFGLFWFGLVCSGLVWFGLFWFGKNTLSPFFLFFHIDKHGHWWTFDFHRSTPEHISCAV